MRKELEKYLESEPKARERKNKYRAIANQLLLRYHLTIPKQTLEEIVYDAVNGDRAWRKILQERPELRGTDYGEKEALEEKALIKLEYRVSNAHGEEITIT